MKGYNAGKITSIYTRDLMKLADELQQVDMETAPDKTELEEMLTDCSDSFSFFKDPKVTLTNSIPGKIVY